MSSHHLNRLSYTRKNLLLNTSIEFYPFYVVSPDLFFIISAKDLSKVKEVEEKCQHVVFNTHPNTRPQDVKLNAAFVYLDHLTNLVHRVRVIKYSTWRTLAEDKQQVVKNKRLATCGSVPHNGEVTPPASSDEEDSDDELERPIQYIDVEHVDTGDISCDVSLCDLWTPTQELLDIPCLAIPCALGGIEPKDYYWNPASKRRFREIYMHDREELHGTPFGFRPYYKDDSQRYVGQIIKSISCIVNIGDLMVARNLANRVRLPDSITHYGPIDPMDTIILPEVTQDEEDFGEQNENMKYKLAEASTIDDCRPIDTLDVPKKITDTRPLIDSRSILAKILHRLQESRSSMLGSLIPVKVVHFESPHLFYYHLSDSAVQSAFIKLTHEIELHFNSQSKAFNHLPSSERRQRSLVDCLAKIEIDLAKSIPGHDPQKIQVPKYVIVEFSHERGARHLYYRAILTPIVWHNQSQYEHKVYLYDIGSFVYIRPKRFVAAFREHFQHPSFAIPGRIYGILPKVELNNTRDQNLWSSRVMTYISGVLTSNDNIHAFVHPPSEDDHVMSPGHVSDIEIFIYKTGRANPTEPLMHVYASLIQKLLLFNMVTIDPAARNGRPSGNLRELD